MSTVPPTRTVAWALVAPVVAATMTAKAVTEWSRYIPSSYVAPQPTLDEFGE